MRFGIPGALLYINAGQRVFTSIAKKTIGNLAFTKSIFWLNSQETEIIMGGKEYRECWNKIKGNPKKCRKIILNIEKDRKMFLENINSISNKSTLKDFQRLFQDYTGIYSRMTIADGGLVGSEEVAKFVCNE